MKRILLLSLVIIFGANINQSFSQNSETFANRRLELSKTLSNTLIILPSQIVQYNKLIDNKNFYYLTGFNLSNSILIVTPEYEDKDLLITENRSIDKKISENFEIIKKEDVVKTIYNLSKNNNKVAISFDGIDKLKEWNINLDLFNEIIKVDQSIYDMRITKDQFGLKNTKLAIEITAKTLNEVFKYTEPGLTEKDLRSIIRYGFESNDTEEAFLQVASGPNSTNIHFGATDRILKENDLIVFDVGTYYDGYTSDISRTIPASGKFSESQTEIYNVVLKAQKVGIELTKKGLDFDEMQTAITTTLIDGLYDLKLITDKNSEWQKSLYIMHGWSHLIGLDVHDVIRHYRNKEDKTLKKGMVLTIEPGLYFPENYLNEIPEKIQGLVTENEFEQYKNEVLPMYRKYENNGVRIEDDVLITDEGNVILSKAVPKEIGEIEKLMQKESFFNKQ